MAQQEMRTGPRVEQGYDGAAAHRTSGSGWMVFAAVLFIGAAGLNVIWGISALVNDDYFAVDELLFGDLSMWGVIYLCVAAAQLAAGLLILARSAVGAILGIGLALVHAMLTLLAIGAYPLWSTVMLVLDGMIIYGLTVYGFGEE
ncbi:MAG TPA: hypothetical protein VFR97_14420 [Capillimicrobium sp.]|nr:hypothetical protein [Capillimicrobium sp.]